MKKVVNDDDAAADHGLPDHDAVGDRVAHRVARKHRGHIRLTVRRAGSG